MSPLVAAGALLAMLPAMAGDPPPRAAGSLVVGSCGGAGVSVPLPTLPIAPATEACCAKGCHAQRSARKRIDRAQ